MVRLSDGNLVLPGNMVLGAARQPELAYEAGLAQGEDLHRLGFNMNLAPVLDVNSNPQNPVIGIRAFGDDVALVSEMGARFVRGQQDAHIVTVAKHFPGHGAVDADSHKSLPIRPGADAAGARAAQALRSGDGGGARRPDDGPHRHAHADRRRACRPRSRPGCWAGVLRDELHFKGLVITDELEMDAIDRRYGVGRAAVLAVNAGADMVLVPWRLEKKEEVWLSLLEAARSGELPRERLDDAVRRMLHAKISRGLFEPLPPLETRLATLGEKRELAGRIASAGVTLLRSKPGLFPLDVGRRIAVITTEPSLIASLGRRFPSMTSMLVPAFPAAKIRDELKLQARALAGGADVVVVAVVNSRQLELVTNAGLSGRAGDHRDARRALPRGAGARRRRWCWRPTRTARRPPRRWRRRSAGERGTPGRLPVALPQHALRPRPRSRGAPPGGQARRPGLDGRTVKTNRPDARGSIRPARYWLLTAG